MVAGLDNPTLAKLVRSGQVHRELRGACRSHAAQNHLVFDAIVDEYVRFILASRDQHGTWQHAWNDFVGPRRSVRVRPARCLECGGRRYVTTPKASNLASFPICGECHGSGQGKPMSVPAEPVAVAEQVES